MPAAAGHLNADDFAAASEIDPVVIDLPFVLVVHERITPLYIVANPNIALDQYSGNPCLTPFKAKKRYLCQVSANWLKNIKN
jgi:hypothetical protein